MCGCVVGGWSCDVADHMGGVGGRAINTRRMASSLQHSPVGGGRGARMVGSVMGEVGGVRMGERRWRGRGKVGRGGWSFIWHMHKWGRGCLIWIQENRGGRACGGRADGGGAFHGRGGA